MLVEIGGGTKPIGADIVIDPAHPHPDNTYKFMAESKAWPIESESVDSVYASHVLEHIAAGKDRIHVFNEAHRILKVGGNFDVIIPLVGYGEGEEQTLVQGWWPYADPTHISFWWFPQSLLYFCKGDFKPHADYGILDWRLEEWHVNHGFEGVARLIKI